MGTADTIIGHVPLSVFASELLHRVREHLDDPGAFGRVIQEAIAQSLEPIHPGLLDHPGAGVPDIRCTDDDDETWAWEIKYTPGGTIPLGERDLQGVTAQGTDHPRLVAVNIDFPVQLWVLDADGIEPGDLPLASRTDEALLNEAQELATELEALLLRADVDLIASESEAKGILRNRSAALTAESGDS